jgi:coenzyme F420 hydrogenase subunit beta
MIKVTNIEDVVNYQLCSGCGICSVVEPQRYTMVDLDAFGVRPQVIQQAAPSTGQAFKACPGHSLEQKVTADPDLINELRDCWGPVYGVWEGYAADEAIRFRGSSGGAATALSLYGLEQENAGGVVQIKANDTNPLISEPAISTTREALLNGAGSRYAPADPCSAIASLPDGAQAIFVGKPCDVAAVKKWEGLGHNSGKISVTIGFFCAGTPSTEGNRRLLQKMGIKDNKKLLNLKFRGLGWPGTWRAEYSDDSGGTHSAELSYAESWGFLQRHRQWRCYICPDHTSEFADIAVGDPWYRKVTVGEHGKSLIVARTRKGLEYLMNAERKGYIVLETKDPTLLPRSQPNLIRARGELWGRLLALKLLGAPIPKFRGFPLFRFWRDLPFKHMVGSLFGTMKRVKRKKLKVNQKLI